jgi:twinkle protein
VLTVWRNKRKESDPERHRHEPDAMLICDKQRNGEWEGRIGLWFAWCFVRLAISKCLY